MWKCCHVLQNIIIIIVWAHIRIRGALHIVCSANSSFIDLITLRAIWKIRIVHWVGRNMCGQTNGNIHYCSSQKKWFTTFENKMENSPRLPIRILHLVRTRINKRKNRSEQKAPHLKIYFVLYINNNNHNKWPLINQPTSQSTNQPTEQTLYIHILNGFQYKSTANSKIQMFKTHFERQNCFYYYNAWTATIRKRNIMLFLSIILCDCLFLLYGICFANLDVM